MDDGSILEDMNLREKIDMEDVFCDGMIWVCFLYKRVVDSIFMTNTIIQKTKEIEMQ